MVVVDLRIVAAVAVTAVDFPARVEGYVAPGFAEAAVDLHGEAPADVVGCGAVGRVVAVDGDAAQFGELRGGVVGKCGEWVGGYGVWVVVECCALGGRM